MFTELKKHAQVSASLRQLVLEKRGGLLTKALKHSALFTLKHPVLAATVGLGAKGAVGDVRRAGPAFNPAIHRAQLGME